MLAYYWYHNMNYSPIQSPFYSPFSGPLSPGWEGVAPSINVFLIAGQSNTDGRVARTLGPAWITSDPVIDGVKVWDGSGIVDYDLTDYGQAGNGSSWIQTQSDNNYSFVHVALKKIADSMINDVVVCQVTSGGTALDPEYNVRGSWSPGGPTEGGAPHLLDALEDRFNALSAYCTANNINLAVKGILWHQGEADSLIAGAPALYAGRFATLINKIRTFTSSPSLPIYYGTVSDGSTQHDATIEAAHLAYAASDPNAHCLDVFGSGLTLLPDTLHFDASGCNRFGDWVGDMYLLGGVNGAGDLTVPTFTIPAVSDADPNTLITSSPVTPTGMDVDGVISVYGGAVQLNGTGGFNATSRVISPGDSFEVQATSAASGSTTAIVVINGVAETFTVTVTSAPVYIAGPDLTGYANSAATGVTHTLTTITTIVVARGVIFQTPLTAGRTYRFSLAGSGAVAGWSMVDLASTPTIRTEISAAVGVADFTVASNATYAYIRLPNIGTLSDIAATIEDIT